MLACLVAALASACGGAAPHGDRASEGRLWVLAPHPDDEVLMAAETIREAIAHHRPLSILVMTNGDYTCTRNGHVRQGETIAALATLGVPESAVRFLGYPDGWLDALGPTPLDPLPRAAADGTCGTGDHTYAERGATGTDVHTALTGAPGAYVASGPVEDLAALLTAERPSEIVVAHGIDTHPDHAMTYIYLRRAIERAVIVPPRILRSLVHQGPCWPNGAGVSPCPPVPDAFGTPVPALAPPLDAYLPSLRLASPDGGAAKRDAIALYLSQFDVPRAADDWLTSFARADEVFWPEPLAVGGDQHTHHAPTGLAGEVGSMSETSPGVWAVHHEAPFVLRFEATLRSASGHAGVTLLGGTTSPLSLVTSGEGAELRYGSIVLRRLPLPHGESAAAFHAWEIRVDPRPEDGNVAEVSVRRDGVFWLEAVITAEPLFRPAPMFAGETVTLDVEGGAVGAFTLTALPD